MSVTGAAPIDAEEQFRKYLDAFRFEGTKLGMFIAVYRYLYERRRDALAEMNMAPAFFQTVTSALRTVIIVWAHKLVVGGTVQEVSLRTFLTFVGENLDLFSTDAFRRRRQLAADDWRVREHEAPTIKDVRADRKRLSGLKAVPTLETHRNKYQAHFDPAYFLTPDALGNLAPLRWADLDEIRTVLAEILNRYSGAFNGEQFVFEPVNADDIQYVFEALRRFRES